MSRACLEKSSVLLQVENRTNKSRRVFSYLNDRGRVRQVEVVNLVDGTTEGRVARLVLRKTPRSF
jgi:hypothetical protein